MLGFFFRKSELWLEMFVPRQVRQFFVVDVFVVQEHVFEGGHFLSWPPEIALLNFTGPSRCSSQQSVGACHHAAISIMSKATSRRPKSFGRRHGAECPSKLRTT